MLPSELLGTHDRDDTADETARAANFPEFADGVFETVFREHKPLGFADIPTTDPLFARLVSARDALFEEPRRDIETGLSFTEAFEHWKRSVDEWTTIQIERERY